MKIIRRYIRRQLFIIKRIYRQILSKNRALPEFLIVGAQKSGTTSLYSYLSKHPNIIPATKKEVHYFDLYHQKSINWYKSFFPKKKTLIPNKITGEASPQYMFYPGAIERIKETLPEVKIIMILRNPITRSYSHYNHQIRMKREKLTFEQCIELEPSRISDEEIDKKNSKSSINRNLINYSYLERGKYYQQVLNVYNYFDSEDVYIIQSELFNKDPQLEYNKVLSFLGLPHHNLDFSNKYNAHRYPQLKDKTRATLEEFFKPYNEKLYSLIGERFDW